MYVKLIFYSELGRTPMSICIKARMVGFWQRIINGKNEKISHTLYCNDSPSLVIWCTFNVLPQSACKGTQGPHSTR